MKWHERMSCVKGRSSCTMILCPISCLHHHKSCLLPFCCSDLWQLMDHSCTTAAPQTLSALVCKRGCQNGETAFICSRYESGAAFSVVLSHAELCSVWNSFFSFCIRYSLLFPTVVVMILKPKLLEWMNGWVKVKLPAVP